MARTAYGTLNSRGRQQRRGSPLTAKARIRRDSRIMRRESWTYTGRRQSGSFNLTRIHTDSLVITRQKRGSSVNTRETSNSHESHDESHGSHVSFESCGSQDTNVSSRGRPRERSTYPRRRNSRHSFTSISKPRRRISLDDKRMIKRAVRNSIRDSLRASFETSTNAASSVAADAALVSDLWKKCMAMRKSRRRANKCKVSFVSKNDRRSTTMVDFTSKEVASLVSELWKSCMSNKDNLKQEENSGKCLEVGEKTRTTKRGSCQRSANSVKFVTPKTKMIPIATELGSVKQVPLYEEHTEVRYSEDGESGGAAGDGVNAYILDVKLHRGNSSTRNNDSSSSEDSNSLGAFEAEPIYTIVLADGREKITNNEHISPVFPSLNMGGGEKRNRVSMFDRFGSWTAMDSE